MKKIYSILLTVVALLSIAPFAKAQEPPYILVTEGDAAGLAYSKKISPPSGGKYTITLESFVTGELHVTSQSIPADIVLVLDVSGSMAWNMSGTQSSHTTNYERINALKTAVKAFIEQIDINDVYEKYVAEGSPENVVRKDEQGNPKRLGNRIAIVTFADDASTEQQLTALTSKASMITTIDGLTTGGGTQADEGMTNAYNILNTKTGQYAVGDDRKLRTTVLFTDGDPGNGSYWTTNSLSNLNSDGRSTWNTANSVINTANNIKNMADEDKDIISRVFTISIQADPSDYTNVYLGKTSSDFEGATRMAQRSTFDRNNNSVTWNSTDIWANGNGRRVATKYAFATTDADKLKEVFETIAGESGGSTIELDGETTATVDIVSKSFKLPNGGNVNDIKIYTYDCYGIATVEYEEDGETKTGQFLQFNNKQASSLVPTLGKSDPTSEKYDSISVKGFNYSEKWCGFNEKTGQYQGQKLSIEIPVMMDDDAVGGADIQTNAPGSGIYIAGQDTPFVEFVSPVVSLPINIHIRKEGLNEGESSKFTIQRKLKTEQANAWKDVTSVFVTRHHGQDSVGVNAPLVKVVGLPSVTKVQGKTAEYVYQIIENDWSWSYKLNKIYGYNHDPETDTISEKDLTQTGAISTEINRNPFIFKNKKSIEEPKVRHAESKATNIFEEGKGTTYDDSKDNKRTVITVTTGSN